MIKGVIAVAAIGLIAAPLTAQERDYSRFTTGPVFADEGPNAEIASTMPIPAEAMFMVAMDVAERTSDGDAPNRTLISAARLINMHARAGVPVERTKVAVVVHGAAALDLLSEEAYAARFDGAANPNAAIIEALTSQGVRVILCGQSGAAQGIDETRDLAPGVEVALSAMTAHALLQQSGYTLNPF